MNINELKLEIEMQFTTAGVTDEMMINHYGSTENFANEVIKTLKSHKDYETVFGEKVSREYDV